MKLYQRTLSLDHGPLQPIFTPIGFCKFNPSCSEYSYQAIESYGVVQGVLLGTRRILRCNPWSEGGYDPISHKLKGN